MFRTLLKKQMTEVFRNYFYNAKKNAPRSKGGIIMMFVLFGFLLVVVLGGMFTGLSVALCYGMVAADMGWLYFALMCLIAVTFGTFGSIFNTFTGLYLPKDNDILLSMPIPVKTIILSRLVNVYLMGTMYAATALIPTLVVYWVTMGITVANFICGLLLFLIVTFLIMILSCLLGWIVAKISLKLKNKSFITVIISLAFIGLYYFFYFKARDIIADLITNAVQYGKSIKDSAYVIYLFGRTGEGSLLSALIFTLGTALLFFLVLLLLSKNFLKLASAGGAVSQIRYREKRAKEKSLFGALLAKEFCRFRTNPGYMLNCGLGVVVIPVLGILLLIKGTEILSLVSDALSLFKGTSVILMSALIFLITTMNDMAAPSLSLEGKSIWIVQSMPVKGSTVLAAKTSVQMILTGIPVLFTSVCAAIILDASVPEKIFFIILNISFVVFMSYFDMFLGTRNPILDWTNEIIPIKQTSAVVIAVFGGWGIVAAFVIPYFLIGIFTGPVPYMIFWSIVYSALAAVLGKWQKTKGEEIFSSLS